MEGQPAGVLQEAFQELERVLNAKYKTTAANRIVVALLPTPPDRLRERMGEGWGDIAAYGIFDHRTEFWWHPCPTDRNTRCRAAR